MSISSILAFVLAGAAVKNRRADGRDEKRVAELEAKLAATEGERDRQYDENVGLIARIAELERVNEQLQRVAIDWQARALPPRIALQEQAARMQQMQQAQLAYQNQDLAQHQAQLAYQAQHNNAQQNVGMLLGAQNFDSELFCNCVPARHDLFLRGD